MARFWYARTKREVVIPDEIAAEYDGRKHYTRLDPIEEPPEGSVTEVLDWVGDDPARRQQALDAELEGRQRATLIKALSA